MFSVLCWFLWLLCTLAKSTLYFTQCVTQPYKTEKYQFHADLDSANGEIIVHSCSVGIIEKMSSSLRKFAWTVKLTTPKVGDVIHAETWHFLHRHCHLCCNFCTSNMSSSSFSDELEHNIILLTKFVSFALCCHTDTSRPCCFYSLHFYILDVSTSSWTHQGCKNGFRTWEIGPSKERVNVAYV